MIDIDTDAGIQNWLAGLGLADFADKFAAHGWRGTKLLEITREELADPGISKDRRGEVMLAIEALRTGDAPVTWPDESAPSYAPALTAEALARCRALSE